MEENNKISYISFLEDIQGKEVNEIYELLISKNIFVDKISSTDEFLIVGETMRRIQLCDNSDSNQYSFLKR